MAKLCTCGQPKIPGAGHRYCQECRAIRFPSIEASSVLQAGRDGPRRTRVKAQEGCKWCSACQSEKPLTSFKGKASYCILCTRDKGFADRLMRVYGMTVAQYEAILAEQGGTCAMCPLRPRTKRLHVDHCHKQNIVRGLLCSNCNSGVLASAKDDPEILRRGAAYLEDPPAVRLFGPIQCTELANKPRRVGRGRPYARGRGKR